MINIYPKIKQSTEHEKTYLLKYLLLKYCDVKDFLNRILSLIKNTLKIKIFS